MYRRIECNKRYVLLSFSNIIIIIIIIIYYY